MSKFGKIPISIENVAITLDKNIVTYKGKFSSGKHVLPPYLSVEVVDKDLFVKADLEYSVPRTVNIKAQWGLHRALLNNAIGGSRQLFKKILRIEGLGYKAEFLEVVLKRDEDAKKNNKRPFQYTWFKTPLEKPDMQRVLAFSLGFSHYIKYLLPDGITIEIDKKSGQEIILHSFDKELLGLVASQIRSLRPPEPYKGKGIKYDGEIIHRKAGKAKS